jgi:hypothetical protein
MLRLFLFFLLILFSWTYPPNFHAQEAGPYRDPIVIQVIHLDYADAYK